MFIEIQLNEFVLFWIFFAINVGGIGACFVHFYWYWKTDITCETTIQYPYKMTEVKETNIKNRTYYFYNDQKDFGARLLKVDKKDYKEFDTYNIGYVTVK